MTECNFSQNDFKTETEITVDWREILTWINDLPPMPNVASKVMNLLNDVNATANQLSELLKKDTALSSGILKLANSSLFSRQKKITTINQAVMIIGFKALKGIVIAATIKQMNQSISSIQKIIWEHSIAVAMFATNITKFLKKPYVDEIFMYGMLHSLGQIVILNYKETKGKFQKVFDLIKNDSCTYSQAEQKIFGFTHPLIGALVAKKWNFPDETCQIILHYADLLEKLQNDNEQNEKTLILRLAHILSCELNIGIPTGYPKSSNDINSIALNIGFNKNSLNEDIKTLLENTQNQFIQEESLY